MTETVTMWFDPTCPYTWRTSRCPGDVTRRRDSHEQALRLLSAVPEFSEIKRARAE
ncbi:MAG TPA: hypothetical protein VF054_03495 [Micromonosporaceae bacterium]